MLCPSAKHSMIATGAIVLRDRNANPAAMDEVAVSPGRTWVMLVMVMVQ